MSAYPEAYLDNVVEAQGKLFDYYAQTFTDKDTIDFIISAVRLLPIL